MDETRSSLVNRVTIWDPSLYETELMCICTKTRRTMFSRILSSIVLLRCTSHWRCNLESFFSGPYDDVAPISSRVQAWFSILSEQWPCTHAREYSDCNEMGIVPAQIAGQNMWNMYWKKKLLLFPAWPRFCRCALWGLARSYGYGGATKSAAPPS